MTRTVALILSLLFTATLAGCADDAADEAPATVHTAANGDVYNDADIDFATEMIRHHADALVMVDLTQGRRLSPEMTKLTEDIRAAQVPEIETMVDWLTTWREDVPETSRDHVNSHSESDDATGMDPDDLTALEGTEGAAVETTWLEMMIEHHEGAIEMAEAEQEAGVFRDAVALAESIETSQAAGIDRMAGMLAR